MWSFASKDNEGSGDVVGGDQRSTAACGIVAFVFGLLMTYGMYF